MLMQPIVLGIRLSHGQLREGITGSKESFGTQGRRS